MKRPLLIGIAALAAVLLTHLPQNARADVKLPSVIASHMVLQRDKPLPIWGWADPGEEVTVKIGAKSASTKADAEGKWKVTLPAMKADGKTHQITISGKNKIELEDVLIGEVWVGSGQSNMEWPLRATQNSKKALAAANHPRIRLFHVPLKETKEPAKDVKASWQACTPKTVPNFSGVLYYFGVRLEKDLDVPIGLINSSWGGSAIEPWTVTEKGSGRKYNAMIAPLQPFPVRGVLWYQGETNVFARNGVKYRDKMEALIKGWRRTWDRDLPFYFVQIAPWAGGYPPGELPALWEGQVASLKIPNTGMVVVTDLVDNIKDIHPTNKRDVGNRLALWALARTYGKKGIVYSGPLYKSMKIEGDKVRLSFAHVGGGLKSRDGKALTEFQIAGADDKFVPASAVIDGKTVVVQAKGVASPTQVRFGWHKLANPNLMNAEGLPASPFQTKNWQGGTGETGAVRAKGGRKMLDPNTVFNFYSGGADTFDINKVPEEVWQQARRRNPQAKEDMIAFLKKKGVKNGLVTRQLYSEYLEDRMAAFRAKKGGVPGGGPGGTGKDGKRDLVAEAKRWFEFLDTNKDGVLDRDEVRRTPLSRDFDKWDKNKDGKIQLEEYTEYYKDNEARRAKPKATTLPLKLRTRVETKPGSGRFHAIEKSAQWDAKKTAIIVCDMWDLHHCLNATRRVGELAPRMNQLLTEARSRGALIIHAPSSCMNTYKDHPARVRMMAIPRSKSLPKEIGAWCHRIPSEEKGKYPIDQSDGGEDDDLAEHAAWAAKLKDMGRNPRAPWKSQFAGVKIDNNDLISDSGEEIWSALEQRKIDNVILLGVHTNMCVLGRPFGLRQMAKNGKNVVLMRDMTDTMYNPARAPFVSHFTGTDLIVEHIEKWVCPSVTSDQVLGGKPFRFAGDHRPRVVIVIAEDEYDTNRTLPEFALKHLGKTCQVSYVHAGETKRNDLPGIEALNQADVALISVRRRPLPPEQLAVLRKFVASGKAVVGIRTASHAFSPAGKAKVPAGLEAWREFDRDVFGGNYVGHHGVGPKVEIKVAGPTATKHPILKGVSVAELRSPGSLYKVRPLAKSTTALLIGTIPDQPSEPVAWINTSKAGGRVFYTSLGHVGDFKQPAFNALLRNAILWAAGAPK